jgi:drug/metabolite transporter (DMT)-like permease
MGQVSVVFLAVLCALVTTAGQIALKTAVSNPELGRLLASAGFLQFLSAAAFIPMVWVGLSLYALSAVMWLAILARAELSYAFPLVSLGFVLSALYAHFGMHEQLTSLRVAGIALIVAGVICVARS